MYVFGYIVKFIKFFFKEPDNILTEDKSSEMEGKLTNWENKQWNSFHKKNLKHRM